jgi:hypothetical protein
MSPLHQLVSKPSNFHAMREEDATKETGMQVLVLCMSAKKQHVMNN